MVRRGVVAGQAAWTATVNLGRREHVQILVGADVIALVLPAVEAPLLRGQRGRRRLRRLRLQIAMGALMRAVLLRRSRTDELYGDALVDPPHAQLREPTQAQRGEGRAVVDADDLRQTVATHQLLERSQRAEELLVGPGPAGQDVVTEQIAHRQRIATLTVAEREPALEIHRPNVIGVRGHGQLAGGQRVGAGRTTRPLAQPMPSQYGRDRAAGGRPADAVVPAQQSLQLLRPPRAVLAPLAQDQPLDLLGGLVSATKRATAALMQPERSELSVTPQPLVAGLAADLKIRAQLSERKAARGRETDEALLLFHWGYFVPGHSPGSVTHVPGQTVTYVPGSYPDQPSDRPSFARWPSPCFVWLGGFTFL